jgi:hypothetical protein
MIGMVHIELIGLLQCNRLQDFSANPDSILLNKLSLLVQESERSFMCRVRYQFGLILQFFSILSILFWNCSDCYDLFFILLPLS